MTRPRLIHRSAKLLAIALTLAALGAACSSEDPNDESSPLADESEPLGDPVEPNADPETPVETIDDDPSSYLFDQEQFHTFELNLSEEDLVFLDAAPAREEYVDGTLTFEGETIPVGIRYKGSIGAFLRCVGGNDGDPTASPEDISSFLNTSGAKTCQKLSIKVKTNWEDSNDEFYGQRRLQFHSMNNDDSQMRDRLAYWLFGQMGVPAPRATHARVVINGEFSGVYAMVEQIDGRFTRRNFDDGTGNLYKEVWPLTSSGLPQDTQVLLNSLETNEDEDPSVALMQEFAAEVATAGPDDVRATIEKWMDVESILAHMVVERTIRHDDGPSHWRCTGPVCFNHNYFWYMDPSAEKAHLIPWDLDAAFVTILQDIPLISVYDGWGEITDNCAPVDHGGFIPQRSAACDPLYAAWALFDEEYEQLLDDFLAGPFAEESVNAQLDAWTAQIAEVTAEADSLFDDALTIGEWESNLSFLRTSLEAARSGK